MTNTSEISFLIGVFASIFLIYLNSSLNPLVYCWRYREIRQIVKKDSKENNSHEREYDTGKDLNRKTVLAKKYIMRSFTKRN